VLRLYLAAYCRPPLNKELWGSIVSRSATTAATSTTAAPTPVLAASADAATDPHPPPPTPHHRHSNQGLSAAENEAAVQAFVRCTPLAVAELIDCLLAES
jgi:hypothetical protein